MTELILHGDFETRALTDLRRHGLGRYLECPHLRPWCFGFKFSHWHEPVSIPFEYIGKPQMYGELCSYLAGGGLFYAHNAQFEYHVWNRCMVPWGWPKLKLKQMRCTMAMAARMALPLDLDNATAAVGIGGVKDMRGRRLMLQMAKPRKVKDDGTIIWWDDDDRLKRLYSYCKQDVVAEEMLHSRLLELPPYEQEMWFIDQAINQRGIPVNLEKVNKAIALVEKEKAALNAELAELTGGAVTAATQSLKLKEWLNDHGVPCANVTKPTIAELLKEDWHNHTVLGVPVKRALEIRQQVSKTSTSKLEKMRDTASKDGRIRFTMQYHGANTGRWGGRGIQPHNFQRPNVKQPLIDYYYRNLDNPDDILLFADSLNDAMADTVRSFIEAPKGKVFLAGDWSAIEGRGLPWLAGDHTMLKEFNDYDKGIGPEPYLRMAESIFDYPCTKDMFFERQVGKVTILQLGYEGGIKAWLSAANNYGIDLDVLELTILPTATPDELDKAERAVEFYYRSCEESGDEPMRHEIALACDVIKQRYRNRYANIVAYWSELKEAAMNAVLIKGAVYAAGDIRRPTLFKRSGSFLVCKVPSGHTLFYPYPKVQKRKLPWHTEEKPAHGPSLSYKRVDPVTRQWRRVSTHGGKLAENTTSCVCAGILRHALVRLTEHHYPVDFHVHDEVVLELPEDNPMTEEDLVEFLCHKPNWAKGFPLAASAWRAKTFRKE